MCTLYERIQYLCKQKGVSASKMCIELGLSKSTMSDMKSGRKSGVSVSTAQKIASYFGISVDDLYGNETKKDPTAQSGEAVKNPSDEIELTEGEKAWIKLLRRFPAEQKAILLERILSELDNQE